MQLLHFINNQDSTRNNEKVVGLDGIHVGAMEMPRKLFNQIGKGEMTPDEWSSGTVFKNK